MTYLPAPYESAQQDDLPAALSAGLTITLAAITSWITGRVAYDQFRFMIDQNIDVEDVPAAVLVPSIGWGIGVLIMVIGMFTLGFRRGRSAIMFGAAVSAATTAIAQFVYGYPGEANEGTGTDQWLLYWGGVAVLLVASLPATKRWIAKKPPTAAAPPGVTGSFGATLWPGT